ncbi:TetR family transcriptional regulator C-terminal domain-containing protein [Microbacterium sp.]|uniref:TetR/AcrR family transcriptional regulator n=1 Tax=Microbacterium sp. TaxID=51671 RepID=UPI0028110DC7|nr:TetR family transcriptional regulator C-terminal domain-containing protein [Microbacterium sp.]
MPKIVDREARRLEIVETYVKLAAAEGFEAVTTRRLASELGVAAGALWHYFKGFDEVLLRAFQLMYERTDARMQAQTDTRRGIDALCAVVEQTHPLDPLTSDEAHVVVSFWGRVPFHKDFAQIQSSVEDHWHRTYSRALEQAVEDGELVAGTPVQGLTDALLALVTGYQVEHVLRTRISEPSRQWGVIQTLLGPWLTPAGAERGRFAERAAAVTD